MTTEVESKVVLNQMLLVIFDFRASSSGAGVGTRDAQPLGAGNPVCCCEPPLMACDTLKRFEGS